jgi:hypothetical protein
VAELQLVSSSEEAVADFPNTVPQWRARYDDAELSLLDVLIQAVLSSNTDALAAARDHVHNLNSNLSR